MSKQLDDIEFTTDIDASLDVVWSNLTAEDKVPQWLGCMRYKPEIGHVFYMQQDPEKRAADDIEGATHCEVLTLDDKSEFSFSWFLPGTPSTVVSIRLEEAGAEATRVKFAHSGWDKFDAKELRDVWEGLKGGWSSFVLPNLKRLCEG